MNVIDNDVKEPMNSSGRKRECMQCISPRRKNDVSAVLREVNVGVCRNSSSYIVVDRAEASVYYLNMHTCRAV